MIESVEEMMQEHFMQSKRRKKPQPWRLSLIVFLFFLVLVWGIDYVRTWKARQESQNDLLQVATVTEVRFRQLGEFTRLKIWCAALQDFQESSDSQKKFAELPDLPGERFDIAMPERVAREVRQEIWEHRLHLDSFVEYAVFKSLVKTICSDSAFSVVPDSSGLRFASHAADSGVYSFRLFEVRDWNRDGDTADYFYYQSNWDNRAVRFKNKEQNDDLDSFLVQFSDHLQAALTGSESAKE